jgi:hypothetical protein
MNAPFFLKGKRLGGTFQRLNKVMPQKVKVNAEPQPIGQT